MSSSYYTGTDFFFFIVSVLCFNHNYETFRLKSYLYLFRISSETTSLLIEVTSSTKLGKCVNVA
jgi:hypothetical protein